MKSIDPHINFNSNISYKLLIKASFKIEKKAKFYYKNTSNVNKSQKSNDFSQYWMYKH